MFDGVVKVGVDDPPLSGRIVGGRPLGQGHKTKLRVAGGHELPGLPDALTHDQPRLQFFPDTEGCQGLLRRQTVGGQPRVGNGQMTIFR